MPQDRPNLVLKPPRRFRPPVGGPPLDAKDRALAQWRGIGSISREKIRERPAKTIDAIMPNVLTTLRWDRRRAEAEIVRVWNNLIAPDIVAHAQPTGINKGTLFVTVDSPSWHCEIVRYRRKEILERLQHSFGRELIARISFRIG